MSELKVIKVKQSVLANNDLRAAKLRGELKEKGVFFLNVMSSPGSGKTMMLIELINRLKKFLRIGVIEADMDAVCAVSGSGPAYVAAMIEAMRDAAVSEGLSPDLAETLALQTVLGTARLIAETGVSPADARVAVCSPGGTTLAALDAMNEKGFAEVFQSGVSAAVRRSKELAKCS